MRRAELRPIDLNTRDVYVTPLGHRCILKPQRDADEHFTWGGYFHFVYLGAEGEFSLRDSNVRILRKDC